MIQKAISMFFVAGIGASAWAQTSPLEQWIVQREAQSWSRLRLHISPTEPKVEGGPKPLPGVVVAALSKKDPDYYFHWVRDSATVMRSVLGLSLARPDLLPRAKRNEMFTDFFRFTKRIQRLSSKEGLGEPRYTIDGQVDTLPWSRPQYDGPALRALAALDLLETLDREGGGPAELRRLAMSALAIDLREVVNRWNDRGFDVWEEYKAENYHTRLVQLAALERGAAWSAQHRLGINDRRDYERTAQRLASVLDDHWDPARGFLRSQLVIVATDGFTAKKTDLDSAVVIAVMEADRAQGPHSVMDDRVQATVNVLENLFASTYPINARADVGLAYGRYLGDVYYGGNPFVLITAAFARFYFRLAKKMSDGMPMTITARNLAFWRTVLPSETSLHVGQVVEPKTPLHRTFVTTLSAKGNSILRRIQATAPEDGRLPEQFDKITGAPASAPDLGWSHSSVLAALFERSHLKASLRR